VGVLAVVVLQESDQPVLEVGCEAEVPALEESARDDTEPKFHLIEPRAMDRGKVKHMAVPDIRQELAALRPGRKRLGVEGDSAQVCHRATDIQALVRVQIIDDPVEPSHLPKVVHDVGNMGGEVRDQCPRTMANVVLFAPFRLSGSGQSGWVFPLENLHAGLFITASRIRQIVARSMAQ
jgi:hypothetical protein